MLPPLHRVAEVFRSGWKAYIESHRVPTRLAQVVRHILTCRTAALGGHLHRCDICGSKVPVYNSCRDRHCLVPGGAWNATEGVWRSAHHRYLFDKNALSKCFQARFISRLESLRKRGKLRFDGEGAAALAEDAAWDLQIRRLWQSKWVVYPKATAKNPEQALDYLGRYTHRVAISDNRILNVQDGQVTFAWRDRADNNRSKTLTIPVLDFIGRFLLHILPRGFQKVRAFGWLSPRHKKTVLAAIRKQLGAEPPPPAAPAGETPCERILRLTGVDVTKCPHCKQGHLVYVGELPPARAGPS